MKRPNRRRALALVEAAVLVLALVVVLSACGRPASAPPAAHATAIVVAHHAHELAPRPSAADLAALRAVAADPDADDAVAHIVAAGIAAAETVDLDPRRPNGDVERGPRVDELLDARLDALAAAVDRAAAAGIDTDLLRALDVAAGTSAMTIVVLSSGLSTTDPLDLRIAGWDRDPGELATDLAERRALPDLSGRAVVFSGLARTAGSVWSLAVGGGIGLLVVLAVLIGQVQAQEAAWRTIAQERRELDQWERELIAAAESRGCPVCRLRGEGDS